MSKRRSESLWQVLQESRSIALLNPRSPEECVTAYELLAPLGVVLEIAFRSEHALPGIQAVLGTHPNAPLLAGTVLTREQAEIKLTSFDELAEKWVDKIFQEGN